LAVKRKFGDSVMSKTDAAMTNEVLCKILCHNLTCLIQGRGNAWHRARVVEGPGDGRRATGYLVIAPSETKLVGAQRNSAGLTNYVAKPGVCRLCYERLV
jgi:hypothetical protein